MCDTEVHFEKPNYAHRDEMFIEDLRASSLSFLAFWSNPAWFRATKQALLPAAAIKEWVAYHRLSVATNKETIVEIISNVKNVIPDSRLAKYGDFSYNVDYEDMYCIGEMLNPRSQTLKANKSVYARRYDFWASETEASISETREYNNLYLNSNNDISDLSCKVRSLSTWLEELHGVLLNVKKIANEAQLMDFRTETLLKFCLRFVNILLNNNNLVKLLNSEMSFIIDYEKIRQTPISKVELLSIPQPQNKEVNFLDIESVDALWLKLSSSRIRNIWKKELRYLYPFDSDRGHNTPLVHLIQINFLRNRQSKSFHSSENSNDCRIDIPKNMEIELLGSLLDVIKEGTSQTGDMLSKMDAVAGSYFPEAHGEWTKNLFPHRVNLPQQNKDFIPWKTFRGTTIPHAKVVKVENQRPEATILPIQYYKSVPPPKLSVPPPTLAARFRIPLLNPQTRNKVMFMRPNDMASNSTNQQVQYKYPSVPVSCVPPAIYTSQTSFSKNGSVPQRFPSPGYGGATAQYQRLNFFRPPYQHNNLQPTKELQKYSLKTEESSCLEQSSVEKKDKTLNEENKVYNNSETKDVNITEHKNVPFMQLNSGQFRLQQTVGNSTMNTKKTLQSGISNSQLQMCGLINYPVTSIRCRTPLNQNIPSPRKPYMLPQFISKPRFLGPITINNLKRIQERIFQQRHQYDCINDPSKQGIQKSASFDSISSHLNDKRLNCEDKVEKWLESVNKYIKPGSYINLEELPELPNVESDELSNAELREHSSVELSEHPRIELSDLSKIGLSKYCRNESNQLSEPLEYPKTELPVFYNKVYVGEKGDCKEPGKAETENAPPEQKLLQDQIKSLFNAPSKIVIKSHENKTNNLKRKKIKAKRVFFEHVQQLRDITRKLKICKSIRKKIKLVKQYFAGINSVLIRRFCLKKFIKALGKNGHSIKRIGLPKRNEFSPAKQQCNFRMKFFRRLSNQRGVDMCKSNLLINDISKYKILIRESQEFNTFPSKRIKLNNSQSPLFETESLIRDQQDCWVASLNYFDTIIDELFFTANGIEEIHSGNQMNKMNAEIYGWTHFKVAVKTVMKNLISSLNTKNSQNL